MEWKVMGTHDHATHNTHYCTLRGGQGINIMLLYTLCSYTCFHCCSFNMHLLQYAYIFIITYNYLQIHNIAVYAVHAVLIVSIL